MRKINNHTKAEKKCTIRFRPVESSNMHSVGWSHGNMEVRFLNNTHYRYGDVPIGIYRRLLRAESKGSFLHYWVKLAGFSYQQLNVSEA